MSNNYENLERLNRLRQDGAITEAEFEREKAKILNSSQAQNSMYNQPMRDRRDKDLNGGYAMALHLVTFVPYVGWLISLIMWLTKKNESPLVRQHGAVLMNLYISSFLYGIVLGFVMFGMAAAAESNNRDMPPALAIFLIIFGISAIIFGISTLVFMILNAIRASKGEAGSYPMAFKFLNNKLEKEANLTLTDHLVD